MLRLPALYPIASDDADLPLEAQVARLGAAGFSLVQVRSKRLPSEGLKEVLGSILRAAEAAGGWPRIVVNDRADLASELALEGLAPWGVHLGQGDLAPEAARALPGLAALHLGASTHGRAEWAGIHPAFDHAGVGPFRATATKGDHEAPIGLEGLRAGCAALRAKGVAPIAIGGLRLEDAADGFGAGAESLAMVGALRAAPLPGDLGWALQAARWRVRPPLQGARGVVLLGSSGAGKSTLGPLLAAGLGFPFRDLDSAIEAQGGRAIARIFAEEGEPAFRALEAAALPALLARSAVIALGGGAWENPENRAAVAAAGFQPLWLAEPPRACWARVARDSARPLAQEEGNFLARCRHRMEAWSQEEPASSFGRRPQALVQALLASYARSLPR